MAAVEYPFTMSDKDRHGNVRWYVRMEMPDKTRPKIRIKNKHVGSAEWVEEKNQHIETLKRRALGLPYKADSPKKRKSPPGSLNWLIDQYCASGEFFDLESATQNDKMSVLYRIDGATHDFRSITKKDISENRDKRRETPAYANKFVKHMKGLYEWAIDRGYCETNPAKEVRPLKLKNTDGWHTWSASQIAAYRDHHEIGTTPRLAFELHYAGLRASDVKHIGRQNVTKDGYLDFIQVKTKHRAVIPIHEELALCIELAPKDRLHLVANQYGRPFAKGYSASFKRWARAAGLPDCCTSHGIRKAMAAELAEAGSSELEIAAHLGQRGTQSVKSYTVGADRKKLASAASKRRPKNVAGTNGPTKKAASGPTGPTNGENH